MKTYKEALIEGNTNLGLNSKTRFIGYGLQKGRALGTLKNINSDQIIEMPVAENLMMGMATGLALKGYLPVVFIERMDFLLNSMDALVNHLDKLKELSNGEFDPKVIIRCIVGNKNKPLYTGVTHVQNFYSALTEILVMPVYELTSVEKVDDAYLKALSSNSSAVFIEFKDLV